jgi:hypothetical protein
MPGLLAISHWNLPFENLSWAKVSRLVSLDARKKQKLTHLV